MLRRTQGSFLPMRHTQHRNSCKPRHRKQPRLRASPWARGQLNPKVQPKIMCNFHSFFTLFFKGTEGRTNHGSEPVLRTPRGCEPQPRHEGSWNPTLPTPLHLPAGSHSESRHLRSLAMSPRQRQQHQQPWDRTANPVPRGHRNRVSTPDQWPGAISGPRWSRNRQ